MRMHLPFRHLAILPIFMMAGPFCVSAVGASAGAQGSKSTASTPSTVAAPAKSSIQWVALEDGVKRASASGKYIFVTVYTDWCGYCRKLNAVTFKAKPVLAELEKNFQSVRVNAESDKQVIWKGKKMTERQVASGPWGVTGFPTMLFISPKGEIIGSYASYAEPDFMVQLLRYISSGARERKVSFDDFIEGKG
jgi:thioredoxin-related protein